MKNKILFISLAVVLALSVGLAGCDLLEPEKDKIYMFAARPLSGPLEAVGDLGFGSAMDYWQDGVNRAGGIDVPGWGKLPVELIIVDDTSDLAVMSGLLSAVTGIDLFDFVLPPCTTPFLQEAAGICSANNYTLIGAEGGCTSIQDQLNNYKYFFATQSFATWDQMAKLFEILRDWQQNDGMPDPANIFIIYVADIFGVEYRDACIAEINADPTHFNLVGNASVPLDAFSVLAQLQQAEAANATLLCSFTYEPLAMLTVYEAIDHNINFDAMIAGPDINFECMLVPAVSGVDCNLDLQGVMGFTTFNEESLANVGGAAANFVQNFTDFFSQPLGTKVYGTTREITGGPIVPFGRFIMNWWGAMPYVAGLEILQEAIEAVGLDNTLVRDELARRNQSNPFDTTFGPAWFVQPDGVTAPGANSGGLLCKEFYHGQIGQWQYNSTKTVIQKLYTSPVWPGLNATACGSNYTGWMVYEIIDVGTGTADGVYPKPDWGTYRP